MDKQFLIIEEAKEIFNQKGINNTSIDDISKKCKISKATFYKYFQNKESLILQILKNFKSDLENKCMDIDSKFDIEPIDKLKQKIITIWEYKYKIYEFYAYASKVLSKNNEELHSIQTTNRVYVISEYKKALLMVYGNNIKDIIWDLIFVIDGLIYEFIILTRNSKQNFDPNFIGDFILNIIESSSNTLNNKKVFMNKEILYGLEGTNNHLTYEDYEKYFYERLNETKEIINNNNKIENKEKLLKAIDEIHKEAINKNYNSLTMDAMIAFLGTERSLSHKVDSLSIIRERLGEGIDER